MRQSVDHQSTFVSQVDGPRGRICRASRWTAMSPGGHLCGSPGPSDTPPHTGRKECTAAGHSGRRDWNDPLDKAWNGTGSADVRSPRAFPYCGLCKRRYCCRTLCTKARGSSGFCRMPTAVPRPPSPISLKRSCRPRLLFHRRARAAHRSPPGTCRRSG